MSTYKLFYIKNATNETDIDEDISGNNYDATITGAVTSDGQLGNSLIFDGNDYVDCTNITSASELSLSFWFMVTNLNVRRGLISNINGSSVNFIDVDTDGTIYFLYSISGGGSPGIKTIHTTKTITMGLWYHCAITIKASTTGILYINNEIWGSWNYVGTSILSSTNNLLLGYNVLLGYYHIGKIDEIMLYSRELNLLEVGERYNSGIGKIFDPTTETSLDGYWRFDAIGMDDISQYVADFILERELEKLLDKLTCKISRRIDNAVNFDNFDPNVELLLKFNNIGIFRGRVKTSDKKEYYTVEAYSSAEILSRTIAKKVYENTTPEDVFSDLITSYTDLTPSITKSDITIERLVADDYISSIITNLSDALGWSIHTDSSKIIYFEPRGTTINSVVIRRQLASSNAIFGEWKRDHNEMCNDIRITGDNINYSTQETFVGDGNRRDFILIEQPIDIKVSINNIEQSVGSYSVAQEVRKITFNTAPLLGASIVIDYLYTYPIYIARTDDTSITTYGRFTKNLFHKWIKTRSDAIVYANNFLTAYKNPLLSNNIIMNAGNITLFTPGEQIRIIDDLEIIDAYYIINKIKLQYIKGTVELNVGSYIPIFVNTQGAIQDRIKELEKNLSKSTIQLYDSQLETLIILETLDQTSGYYVNYKINVDNRPKCDYGRGTLYDARVGLCQA